MPDSEVVRYRGGSVLPQTKSRRLIASTTDSSSNSNNGGEDWITRKRVQTKTTKNIEKRVQRQVVLEDGRIIEEGEPEVTVDTVEDVESHSDDGEEDRHIVGGWSKSFHPDRALQCSQPGEDNAVATWHPGGNTLGETLKRNTKVTDVKQHSYSTTSARNLGDISSKDVKKVIGQGRSTKTFIKPLDEAPVEIPTRMTHKNANRKRMVDTENIEEVQRLQDGVVKTDRYVTRENIEDDNEETPSEGTSTDSESNDGDRDSFSQRKEDRFIDYYTVPRGKSIKEGKFLRHGIHLTSYDKSNKAGELEEDSVRRPALAYKGDSDSTGDMWGGPTPHKPPKSDRPPSRSRPGPNMNRFSSTERESTRSPGPPGHNKFPVHYSKPIPRGGGGAAGNDQKFHTIERSSTSDRYYHTTNTGFGGGVDRRQANRRHHQYRHSMGAGGQDSDSSYSRSRSESRGHVAGGPHQTSSTLPKRSNLKKTNHHSSMGTLKTGGSEATGGVAAAAASTTQQRPSRLKRAMSFTSSETGGGRKPRSRSGSIGSNASQSFIGGFKSLYASLTKSGSNKKEKENRVSAANKAWFDQGDDGPGKAAPQRPPRKARSTASSMTSGQGYSSYNKRQNKSTTNLDQENHRQSFRPSGLTSNGGGGGGSSFDVRGAGGTSRRWEMYSSNTNLDNNASSSPQQQKQQRQRHASPIRKLSPFRRSGKSKSPQRQQSPAPLQQQSTAVASSAATLVRERADRQSTARSERSDHFSDNNSKKQQPPRGLFRNNKRLDSSQSSPDNREPRRFEEERQIRQRGQVRSRFFGQQEVSDGAEGSDEAAQSVRPPPDMRRLLLNNVNLTRSKSMSKDLDQRSSVIRAI